MDVGLVIDEGRWGGYQKRLVLLTALAIIFDGFDNQLLGLALPALMSDWGLGRGAFAPVVSLGYLGMMIGGAVAGVAGDRVGRRTALVGSVLLFGAATAATAVAGGLTSLAALRFLAGIGLGGAIPNAASLAAEYVPQRQRPLAVTLAIVCVPLGGTLAGLVAVPALPAIGWRGLFALGGVVPVFMAAALMRTLPESPRYLVRHRARWPELARVLRRMGHQVADGVAFSNTDAGSSTDGHAGAARVTSPLRMLLAPDLRADTAALWTAFLSCLLAVYLGFSWLPSLLTSAGLGPAAASTSLTVFNLGGVAGAIAGGALIVRFGSKRTMIATALGAVAGSAGLSVMTIDADATVLPILVMLAVTGGLINAVQVTLYALAAHVYPTTIRATGVGTAASVGRTGAILSGYAGPWALEVSGSSSFFGLMAASLLVTAGSLALVKRHVGRR